MSVQTKQQWREFLAAQPKVEQLFEMPSEVIMRAQYVKRACQISDRETMADQHQQQKEEVTQAVVLHARCPITVEPKADRPVLQQNQHQLSLQQNQTTRLSEWNRSYEQLFRGLMWDDCTPLFTNSTWNNLVYDAQLTRCYQ